MKEEDNSYNLSALCRQFGVTRQSYYQRKDLFYEKESMKILLLEYALELREKMPRIGCFKLYEKSKAYFSALPFGRDAYFDLLRESGLMLKQRKRKKARTTDSDHPYGYHQDLLKGTGFKAEAPCRLWVSDITYIALDLPGRHFCYLSLITDAYSRKIVGWELSDSLKYKYTENALRKAIKSEEAAGFDLEGMIHHSDRGVQYAYPDYVLLLKKNNCLISMTQTGDPLDNAMAERVNGILKTEWLNDKQFKSKSGLKTALCEIIQLYNRERPHMGIGMKVPCSLHKPEIKKAG